MRVDRHETDIRRGQTDDSNRKDFEAAGDGPFRPSGEAGDTIMYHSVPVSVLEDSDEMAA